MSAAESYVTPAVKELFAPQFATQDADVYQQLLVAWRNFAEGAIRWPKTAALPTGLPAIVSSVNRCITFDLQQQNLPGDVAFVIDEPWQLREIRVRTSDIAPFRTAVEVAVARDGQTLLLKYAVASQPQQLRSLVRNQWGGHPEMAIAGTETGRFHMTPAKLGVDVPPHEFDS